MLFVFGVLFFFWLGVGYVDVVFEVVFGFMIIGLIVFIGFDSLLLGFFVW